MRLQSHSAKPKAKFFGSDAYYLGVELECEAPDRDARETGLKPRVTGMYAKHDGSLNSYGWEIVTHPFARKLWLDQSPRNGPVKRFFALLKSLRDLKYQSHDGGRCGLHAHVCKKAFGPKGIDSCHFYWFAKLVNGELFRKLSQRKPEQVRRWAKKYDVTPLASYNPYDRYQAVNVRPDKTVEIRIFRGNLREDRVRKCVEAVIAAVEFSRTRKALKHWKRDLEADFREWLSFYDHLYPNLIAYLDELDRPAATEPAEDVHLVAQQGELQCA